LWLLRWTTEAFRSEVIQRLNVGNHVLHGHARHFVQVALEHSNAILGLGPVNASSNVNGSKRLQGVKVTHQVLWDSSNRPVSPFRC